jgi:hypothetical protein
MRVCLRLLPLVILVRLCLRLRLMRVCLCTSACARVPVAHSFCMWCCGLMCLRAA